MSVLRALTLALLLGLIPAYAQGPDDPLVLWQRAAVYRDEWGTPHVYAGDFRALGFAFGYAQAEDHLEAMLLAYRVANGRAAEVFGEYFAQSDEFALKMGHAMLARDAFPSLDPVTRDLCEGFAIGVNAWIVERADSVPPWVDGVEPADPLALLHCYLMSMAPFDLPGAYHREPAFSGNAWAIAPSCSESGEPLLVINPHTFYAGPFLWYEAHLICGDMNVAGATLFGLPAIAMGHNEVLGWALTPNKPDSADVYMEPSLGAKHDTKALRTGKMIPLDKAQQLMLLANARTYYVRTANGQEERSVPCADTDRGPIVGTYGGRMCSYRAGGYRDFGSLFQLVEMARAYDLPSFRAALELHQLPCFHVVYADRAGNIFYLYNAKAGSRPLAEATPMARENEETDVINMPSLTDFRVPLRAEDAHSTWGGVIPVGELPSVLNPKAGFVQACGSPPWAAAKEQGLGPEDLPYWFALDRDTYRAQRVRRLLGIGKRSLRDCQAMLYDVVVPLAEQAVPRLFEIAAEHSGFVANAHPDLAAGLETLRSWNRTADTDCAGMTFFSAWWNALRALAAPTFKTDDILYDAFADDVFELRMLSLKAAGDAARMMRNEFQSVALPWGDVHTIQRGDREESIAGAATGEPIFVAADFLFADRKWRVNYGYGFAMAVAFGDTPRALSVAPFGASEDPQSPHYADQLELMKGRRMKPALFTHEDVQGGAARARGCLLYFRPAGVEGLITLRAAGPVEATLGVSTEAPAKLPANLTPFTLYVEMGQTPRETPADVHLAIYIPPVLCPDADLPRLDLYAYDTRDGWRQLEGRQLDVETRTITAHDAWGARTYAVLGPRRGGAAQRIPGKGKLERAGPEPPLVPAQPHEDEAQPAAQFPPLPAIAPILVPTPEPDPAPLRGVPPRRDRKPIVLPPGLGETPPERPPLIEFEFLDEEDETPKEGKRKRKKGKSKLTDGRK